MPAIDPTQIDLGAAADDEMAEEIETVVTIVHDLTADSYSVEVGEEVIEAESLDDAMDIARGHLEGSPVEQGEEDMRAEVASEVYDETPQMKPRRRGGAI